MTNEYPQTSIRISLITIHFSMFLCTCIRLSYMLGALAISQMQQLDIAINNRYECCFSMYAITVLCFVVRYFMSILVLQSS